MTKVDSEIQERYADIRLVTFTERKGAGFGRSGYAVNRRTTSWGFDGAAWHQIPCRVAYALQARGLAVHQGYAGPEARSAGWPHA